MICGPHRLRMRVHGLPVAHPWFTATGPSSQWVYVYMSVLQLCLCYDSPFNSICVCHLSVKGVTKETSKSLDIRRKDESSMFHSKTISQNICKLLLYEFYTSKSLDILKKDESSIFHSKKIFQNICKLLLYEFTICLQLQHKNPKDFTRTTLLRSF